ncbi:type VI secretion system Vgr family protein [Aquicoccus sp. G2-2]|uniref:type VI secretion system Vgr family protein n=1 Tax=Aquicoccus sp. G2-2 TaxID=3092120 RepID=UPI002AE02B47|nr:type VI secretion system tip protein TssI/VgrG [Aquicoccus sp. G2-2]MEA1114677.1 type VI secretion system tip protein TssI/VgrG [Aquicoccus sp. G2-2]
MIFERIIEVSHPLKPMESGESRLHFANLTGHDRLSECFCYDLKLLSADPDISAQDLLGEAITIKIAAQGGDEDATRYFHGLVDQFHYDGDDEDENYVYRLNLRPTIWFLSKIMDNRIFQQMTVPEIVAAVMDDAGMPDYRLDLSESYPKREYCVQYGESNLDFIQRLLEHEGIFYFFEFDDGAHTMVICDDVSELSPAPDAKVLRFKPSTSQQSVEQSVITRLWRTEIAAPQKYVHTDYDFEKPSADLMANGELSKRHTQDDKERYFYPGKYVEHGRGTDLAKLRNKQDRAHSQMVKVNSTAVGPYSGRVFELMECPRESDNRTYFVHRASYRIWEGQYFAGEMSRGEEQGFQAEYDLISTDTPYHPPMTTPKPVMKGVQTAIVVGPAGEEIHTDEYARVKVQFYWDRKGERDEHSTCFIRVSSVWAGSGWGFIQIPRIGQEVIVDFLEGDPDKPIITGRVYNAEQMPPYALPGNATQSGWKSNSSLGGGGWNEMRFEDKKGDEEVYFQAEKDHNELVKNNESRQIGNDFLEDVGHDATQNVHHDRTETVDNNKSTTVGVDRVVSIGSNDTESVGVDRSLTVGSNESITIGANSTESIGANHSQTVGSNQTVSVAVARVDTVGAAETRTVGAAQSNAIGAARSVTVGANQTHTVAGSDSTTVGSDQSLSVGSAQSVSIGADQAITTGGGRSEAIAESSTIDVGEDYTINVGKNFVLEAGDMITLKVGKATLQMQKDGTVVIEGKDITTKGSGKIDVKASSAVTIKGSKINQN